MIKILNNFTTLPQKIWKYLKEVRSEIAKVTWPTRSETLRYTIIVIVFSITAALILGSLDYLFTRLIKKFLI